MRVEDVGKRNRGINGATQPWATNSVLIHHKHINTFSSSAIYRTTKGYNTKILTWNYFLLSTN